MRFRGQTHQALLSVISALPGAAQFWRKTISRRVFQFGKLQKPLQFSWWGFLETRQAGTRLARTEGGWDVRPAGSISWAAPGVIPEAWCCRPPRPKALGPASNCVTMTR